MALCPEEILGCRQGASIEELRSSYLSLARKHHPDKVRDEVADTEFVRIQQAWQEILARQKELAQRAAPVLVDLDDMGYDQASDNYSYKCRCGDTILVNSSALEESINLFSCESCSLKIHLCYEAVDDDDDD